MNVVSVDSIIRCYHLIFILSSLQGWLGAHRVPDRVLHDEALEVDGHGDHLLAPDLQARLHHRPPAGVVGGEAGRDVGSGSYFSFIFHKKQPTEKPFIMRKMRDALSIRSVHKSGHISRQLAVSSEITPANVVGCVSLWGLFDCA